MSHLRIAILGGGPGGYEAALVAADHGAEVVLVSREGLGGNSVLWDCVPSKALIVSAEAMGWLQSAARLGVRSAAGGDPYSRAEVDLAAVMDRIRALGLEQSDDIGKKVAAAGVRVVEGVGRLAGRQAIEVEAADGALEVVEADVILIATGSNPRVLPFAPPDGERVFTARELFAMRRLPERLVVVGSGATGAEYAGAFAAFGADVHLVSSRDQILPSEDADAAAVIEDVFERRGMTIHRRRRATGLERTAGGVRVEVSSRDGGKDWVEASHVLFCVGQLPNCGGLGLEAAGVTIERGAVPVDGVSRTNVPTIYAAGDVTGRMMLASAAAMQGRNAMWHALGMAVAPLRWETVASCIFTDPEVATVGVTAEEAATSTMPIRSTVLPFTGNPRAKMAEWTDGFAKIHALEGSGTVLGGTVVAARASDLVHPISVAVHNRLSASQLAQAFSVYPSMSGSVQEAARLLMGAFES